MGIVSVMQKIFETPVGFCELTPGYGFEAALSPSPQRI
jgi:hypothetical protein